MESVLIAALLAASPLAAPGENAGPALDRQCFGLMASLAGDEDPRLSAAGQVAAQYFLGRIDAGASDFDPDAAADAAPASDAARAALLRRCGAAMPVRDFRALGEALAPPVSHPTA
ncbi:hypothetical protein [Sphingosinicella sp.]|uniref:hypothetical protein n=1 Tax=Sphingosinicella sp. TaxID=1917971 RepID=UPI0040384E1E